MNEDYLPLLFLGGGGLLFVVIALFVYAMHKEGKRIDAAALDLLRRGMSPTQATHQLAAAGADLEEAGKAVRRVMERVVEQGVAADAARMAAAGASTDEVKRRLEERGLPPEKASGAAADATTARWARGHPVLSVALGAGLLLLGVAGLGGALVLYFGNKSGALPTFPFAGTLALFASAVPLAVGWSLLAGRFRKAP